MPRLPRRRPSPSIVIALIALFVALGGPAEAAKLLDGKRIRPGTVGARQIKDGGVAEKELRNGAVTRAKLSPSAISFLLQTPNASITANKLADGAVAGGKIADKSLGAVDIADGQIGQPQIADNGVAAREIADGAVDSGEIFDGRQFVGDIAAFVYEGELPKLEGTIARRSCAPFEVTLAEVAPVAGTPREVDNDALVVTPELGLTESLVMTVRPRAVPAGEPRNKVTVTVCNPTDSALPLARDAEGKPLDTVVVRIFSIAFPRR